jgi:hypothetical protein
MDGLVVAGDLGRFHDLYGSSAGGAAEPIGV